MAVIKVSIKDKNTLELQEDAKKGDVIDLSCLSTADVGVVSDAVKIAARKEVEKEIEVTKSREIETELLKQEKELSEKHNKETAILKAELQKKDTALEIEIERKKNEINELNNKLSLQETQKTFEIKQIVKDITNEKEKLENALTSKNTEYELSEQKTKERYENALKEKDNLIAYYKDLKLKQNTKMLGETVEKHCHLAFETIRGLLPSNVEFGKDTDASEGSLGDRIYREFDDNGKEILSIMFEMKNEADATSTKKTNEHFLKELDKDRNQKKCEYAVLVSMLEKDNEMYDGIYTVPENKYKDMFVIRPQHFIQIITWLRNVAEKLSVSRRELMTIQQRDRDYTEFDIQADLLRERFEKHCLTAVNKHNDAIDNIDKMIKGLQKIKDDLLGSDKQLRLASEDLEKLTVKKLAKNSPSILEQIKTKKN